MTAEERAAQDAAWAQHNLSQLRYFRALSLRARLEAVEGYLLFVDSGRLAMTVKI